MENNLLPPLIIDNTAAATFRTCPRKYYHRMIEHLTPAYVEAPLNFGAALHAGMAEILRGKSIDEASLAALDGYKEQEFNEREWRTPDRLMTVLSDFHKHWSEHPLEVASFPDGRPMVEIPIGAPFSVSETVAKLLPEAGYSSVIIAGVIDAVVRDAGRLVVLDHKTDSGHFRWPKKEKGQLRVDPFIDPKVWDKFKPHGAAPIYLDVAGQYMPSNMPLEGFIFNVICMSRPTEEFPNGQNLFARNMFEWTVDEIRESRADLNQVLEELLTAKIRGYIKDFRRNPDACVLYNRRCPYIDLCNKPPLARGDLKSIYKVEPWDPLHAYKTDQNAGTE